MKRYPQIVSILFCFFLLGCQSEVNPNNQNPPQGGQDEETVQEEGAEVCYPGIIKEVCLPLIKNQDGDFPWEEFTYLDPLNNDTFPKSFSAEAYLPPHYWVEIEKYSPSLQISPHFQIQETMILRKGPLGLFSPFVVNQIELIRQNLGQPILVNSGFRSPKYNEAVGGALWSRHQYGDAIDIYANTDLQNLAQLCKNQMASFVLVYKSHVHCDWRNEPRTRPPFFPKSSLLPTPSESIHPKVWLSQNIQIEKGASQRKDRIFEILYPHVEDGETPLIHWQVFNQNDLIAEGEGWQIVIPKKQKRNPLQVVVNFGGHLFEFNGNLRNGFQIHFLEEDE